MSEHSTLSDSLPVQRPMDREAVANLRIMLDLVAAGKVKCSAKTLRPSAATMNVLRENLIHGDFYDDEDIATFAWPLLVQAGGLAKLDGTKLQLTPKGRKALTAPPEETLLLLWERWISKGLIDEFSRVEAIKGQRSKNVLTAIGVRRRIVGKALGLLEPNEWMGIDNLFAAMRRKQLDPYIARSDRAQWKLYIEDPEYGSMGYDGYGDWPVLEGRYTMVLLFEYAAVLGFIDVEYINPSGARDDYTDQRGADFLERLSRYDGLTAVRLNQLGSYVLGLSESYEPSGMEAVATDRQFSVSADLVVTALQPVGPAEVRVLDDYSERTSETTWLITSQSLLYAVGMGHSIDEFVEFLGSGVSGELPAALAHAVKDVRANEGLLGDLGTVRVFECRDDGIAQAIAGDSKLAGLATMLGPRHFSLVSGKEKRARTALLKRGLILPL